LGLLVLAVMIAVRPDRLLYRIHTPGPSLADRFRFIASALAAAAARPWLGFGLGTFGDIYPRFARSNAILLYAHCDYAQWLAEMGVVGMAAAAGAAAAYVYRLGRPEKPLQWTCWVSLTACAGHATLEFPFHIPALLLVFALVAGLLAAISPWPWHARTVVAKTA
jgi:O-antigen ligase